MDDCKTRPVDIDRLEDIFRAREAAKERPIAIERHFQVLAEREPQVRTRLVRVDRGDGQSHWDVVVEVDGVRAGGRALPPPLRGEASRIPRHRLDEAAQLERLQSHIPDHLAFSATPADCVRSVRRIRDPRVEPRIATTLFGGDAYAAGLGAARTAAVPLQACHLSSGLAGVKMTWPDAYH